MGYEMIIDVILAVLLAGVIGAAFVLDRRLVVLRSGQNEMSGLIARLSAVTDAARRAVVELKSASGDTQEELQSAISKATGLTDELTLIVEAGDSLADRLANAASEAGSRARARRAAEEKFMPEEYSFDVDGGSDVLMALKEAR